MRCWPTAASGSSRRMSPAGSPTGKRCGGLRLLPRGRRLGGGEVGSAGEVLRELIDLTGELEGRGISDPQGVAGQNDGELADTMDEALASGLQYGRSKGALTQRQGLFVFLTLLLRFACKRREKRRGWDSNPRDDLTPPTRFPISKGHLTRFVRSVLICPIASV